MRIVLSAWRYQHKVEQRKGRIAAFTRNTMHRRKVKHLFEGWRGVSHKWFKENLETKTGSFRADLEGRMLNVFTSKVDALLLYMAQLEDKIKVEQEAREQLTRTYETSLNSGVSKLNTETQVLAENPLVREISLIVARELMKNSQGNDNLTQMIRQKSLNGTLLDAVFSPHNAEQQRSTPRQE